MMKPFEIYNGLQDTAQKLQRQTEQAELSRSHLDLSKFKLKLYFTIQA